MRCRDEQIVRKAVESLQSGCEFTSNDIASMTSVSRKAIAVYLCRIPNVLKTGRKISHVNVWVKV